MQRRRLHTIRRAPARLDRVDVARRSAADESQEHEEAHYSPSRPQPWDPSNDCAVRVCFVTTQLTRSPATAHEHTVPGGGLCSQNSSPVHTSEHAGSIASGSIGTSTEHPPPSATRTVAMNTPSTNKAILAMGSSLGCGSRTGNPRGLMLNGSHTRRVRQKSSWHRGQRQRSPMIVVPQSMHFEVFTSIPLRGNCGAVSPGDRSIDR